MTGPSSKRFEPAGTPFAQDHEIYTYAKNQASEAHKV